MQFPEVFISIWHEIRWVKAVDSGSTVSDAVCWTSCLAHSVGEVSDIKELVSITFVKYYIYVSNRMIIDDRGFAWIDQSDYQRDSLITTCGRVRQDADISEGYFISCPNQIRVVSVDLEV